MQNHESTAHFDHLNRVNLQLRGGDLNVGGRRTLFDTDGKTTLPHTA